MGRNTRGKIKEHLEGMHRNTEGFKAHCEACLALIADANPTAKLTFQKLFELSDVLDDFTLRAYTEF